MPDETNKIERERQTDRETDRETDRQRQTETERDRQTDRQKKGWTNVRTDDAMHGKNPCAREKCLVTC